MNVPIQDIDVLSQRLMDAGVQLGVAETLVEAVGMCLRQGSDTAWAFGLKRGPLPDNSFGWRYIVVARCPIGEKTELCKSAWWLFTTAPGKTGSAGVYHDEECAGQQMPELCACTPYALVEYA